MCHAAQLLLSLTTQATLLHVLTLPIYNFSVVNLTAHFTITGTVLLWRNCACQLITLISCGTDAICGRTYVAGPYWQIALFIYWLVA